MRKKQVEIDGAKFTIASLSLKQVESIISPVENDDQGRTRVYNIICMSINNALKDDGRPESEFWNNDRLKDELDLVSVRFLKEQILEFSNLKQVDAEGEGVAAQ